MHAHLSAVELLGVAASVSLLAGWRLYLCVFAVGLAMRTGWLALPEQLQALDALASPWVIGVAGLGAAAEFLADKVMWLDSLWDAVHTLIRPLGGAVLALALVDPGDPTWQVVVFLLGGGASLLTHGAKATTRVVGERQPGAVQQRRGIHRRRRADRRPTGAGAGPPAGGGCRCRVGDGGDSDGVGVVVADRAAAARVAETLARRALQGRRPVPEGEPCPTAPRTPLIFGRMPGGSHSSTIVHVLVGAGDRVTASARV